MSTEIAKINPALISTRLLFKNELIEEHPGHFAIAGNSCEFDDLDQAILSGILGFCCCGQPGLALDFILNGLDLIESLSKAEPPVGDSRAFWDHWVNNRRVEEELRFGSIGGATMFYYWADKEDLTEHGGTVPGWLTSKGHQLLDVLRENKRRCDRLETEEEAT